MLANDARTVLLVSLLLQFECSIIRCLSPKLAHDNSLGNSQHTHTHKNTQKKTRVRIWLYEDARMQIEGQIIGFDEYMNMVLDSAVEMDSKRNTRTEVGRILLKGDSITLLQYVFVSNVFSSFLAGWLAQRRYIYPD